MRLARGVRPSALSQEQAQGQHRPAAVFTATSNTGLPGDSRQEGVSPGCGGACSLSAKFGWSTQPAGPPTSPAVL